MPKDVTESIALSEFSMGFMFTRDLDEELSVIAERIVDISDLFLGLGRLGIEHMLLKYGNTFYGPVMEMIEAAAPAGDPEPTGKPGVYIAISTDSVCTQYRLNNNAEALDTVGLAHRNNVGPKGLLQNGLFTDRVERYRGNPAEVAAAVFEYLPSF